MLILKIGGGEAIQLEAIADDIARLSEPTVIVHGANSLRNQLAAAMGSEIKTITSLSGYTSVLTDDKTIDLIMMAYAGLRNKRIVELLQQRGINGIGLSGIDGRLIGGKRNQGIRVKDGEKKRLVRDISGKPASLNSELLRWLLERGYTPVISIPIADENGHAINTENDEIVALLQAELSADRIVHLIEAPGLLADAHDPGSRLPTLEAAELPLWEERVKGRMKRKLHALGKLFEGKNPVVYIGDGRIERPLTSLFNGEGTRIQ